MTKEVTQLDSRYIMNSLGEAFFLELRRSYLTMTSFWPSLVHKNHGTRVQVRNLEKAVENISETTEQFKNSA